MMTRTPLSLMRLFLIRPGTSQRLVLLGTLLSLLVLLALATACGKKGFPQPDDPERKFTIAAVEARAEGHCLVIQAQFEGAYGNIEELRLDLEGSSLEDACLPCPFVPNETEFFSRHDVTFDIQTGALSFSYCPKPADIYRWRLSGISRFSSIPHAQSAVTVTQMKEAEDKQ